MAAVEINSKGPSSISGCSFNKYEICFKTVSCCCGRSSCRNKKKYKIKFKIPVGGLGFTAYRTTDQAYDTTLTTIIFDQVFINEACALKCGEEFDVKRCGCGGGGDPKLIYNPSTGIATVPSKEAEGLYQISTGVTTDSANTSTVNIYVNGLVIASALIGTVVGVSSTTLNAAFRLARNDTISIRISDDTGPASVTPSPPSVNVFFSAFRLSL